MTTPYQSLRMALLSCRERFRQIAVGHDSGSWAIRQGAAGVTEIDGILNNPANAEGLPMQGARQEMAARFANAIEVRISVHHDDDRMHPDDVIDGDQLAQLIAMIAIEPTS